MPAFDINAILSAALATAVAEATKPLVERIEALESNITMMQNSIDQKDARIAALENIAAEYSPTPAVVIDEAKMVEALNSQEWFWEKLTRKAREVAEAVAEQSMDNHLECYDHDNYDEAVRKIEDMPDFDDLVRTDDLSESVRDAVQDLSFEVRVS